MAPKTRGASSSGVGMKRKKTVRRPTREPTPDSSTAHSSDNTPAATASTPQVDHLASRVITTGRKFDFDLFEREGLIVGSQLKEMGFEKICSLDCPTYPALVKEFYKNLARGDNGLVSVVRGVGLNVTAIILSKLLRLPLSGPSTFDPEDRSPALTRLLNRNFDGFEEVFANQLPLDLRLLHNICSRILFPKTGRFDYVSERDIFVMDAVVSGKPINLPIMILWYMADCGSKKKSCLPYGMILTQIFRSQGVIISDSEPKKELRHTDYYSLATIHRMGFVKKDGRWERKNAPETRAVGDAPGPSVRHPSPEIHRPPSVPVPAPTQSHLQDSSSAPQPSVIFDHSSSASIGFSDIQLQQIKGLLDHQEARLKDEFNNQFQKLEDSLKAELDMKIMNIKETLYSLDDKVAKVETTLSSSSSSLSTDLKNIFEELKDICGDSETYAKCNAELQEKIITACTFVDEKLKDYVKIQCEGIKNIVDHLTRITRTKF